VSGLPHASWDDLGGAPTEMPITGANAYGSMANFLALASLVDPGDEVLIEQPTYEPLLLAAAHLGASITRFARSAANGFRVDPDLVIAAITQRTKVVVLANLHNPSSQVILIDDLRAIGDAAARVGARVIVDEVYLDAVFVNTPASCVHLGPTFISTNSLTKVYGLSALRCGWIIADDALARRAWRVSDLYGNVQPFAPDWLATVAFDHLPALRARSRRLLDTNRDLFQQWARDRDDLDVTLPEWGTTVCLRPTKMDAARFCEDLRTRYDVSVVPGHFFELPNHVRLGLCTDTAVLQEGLSRIERCLADVSVKA
jgi:aspartate/methionine/tyrosine aminotransferase